MTIARLNVWFVAASTALVLFAGCASNAGRMAGAKDELPTSSDQTDLQKRSHIRLELAIEYYKQHQLPVALDEVKRALAIYPDLSDAYSVRALIYMDMGEENLAEENFLHAIKLAPDNADLSNNYGWFLCQNGRASQALPYFEAAFKSKTYQSPEKALNNAGNCSLKLKDDVAAEQYFLDAFKYAPQNPATNANLGKIYFQRHQYDRARFYIGRAMKADMMTADVLWLAIRIERKLGDRAAETSLVTQLQRRYPNSTEFAAFQRGAFDE